MGLNTKEETRFHEITKDLEWRLDDGSGGPPPPEEPKRYDRGGGGSVWPLWATHLMAFLFGGMTFGWLLIAPPVAPFFALAGVVGVTLMAMHRRWR